MTTSDYVDPELVFGETPIIKEPRIIGDWILWLEQRPTENGRTTALIRPWRQSDFIPQELTPSPIDLRTKVHGYGGAPLQAIQKGSNLLLTWIDNSDKCLWTSTWSGFVPDDKSHDQTLRPKDTPICLSNKQNYLLADGLIDLKRNIWIGLMERNGIDHIVSFSLHKTDQIPTTLYSCKGFLGYVVLSPKGDKLAWVEWQDPFMPWDSSQLNLAQISDKGEIFQIEKLDNKKFDFEGKISFFNPRWSDGGDLYIAEDSSGWWNIARIDSSFKNKGTSLFQQKMTMTAEMAFPQWVLGMSSFSCVGDDVVSAICHDGSWSLGLFSRNGTCRIIQQPFNDLSGINARQNRVVAIASSPIIGQGILEIDLLDDSHSHTPASSVSIPNEKISVGKSFWFSGSNDKKVHAWYYQPVNKILDPPPLLLKSHSGPTGMAKCGLDLEVQFWTSRGWSVLDVNYGGSTGFGREYRDRLKGNWGVVDILDCACAAEKLVASGKADKDLIAITGSSASGFTTLGGLYLTDIFSVAACKYPVCDLLSMSSGTHRFEAFYLDYLIGDIDSNYEKYIERSPIENANKIKTPLILFHGLKDKVISPEQTLNIEKELLKNDIPIEVYLFEDEGHGFKDGGTKVDVMQKTKDFFCKHLNI